MLSKFHATKPDPDHEPEIPFYHKIYVCEPMLPFAELLRLTDIKRFGSVCCIEASLFPDGNHQYAIPYPECDGEKLLYICSYYANDALKIVDQRLIQMLSERGALHLTVVVPFFGSATNERPSVGVRSNGVPYETVAVAALDAKAFGLLGNRNTRMRVVVIDLHTIANRFYFPPDVAVKMGSAIPAGLQLLAPEYDMIATPDEGAHKRYAQYLNGEFAHLESTYFYKERIGDTDQRLLRAAEPGKIRGKRVIIIDDLVRSGNTIAECAKWCRENGALRVSAFVPHAVFPKDEWRKFIAGGEYEGILDVFGVTDSLPGTAHKLVKDGLLPQELTGGKVPYKRPFTVLPLATVAASLI
jgi:phosphoribosylpyrophosphate synthetase